MRFGKISARKMMHNGPVLPLGARWVEYLKSTGTQYIDTGVFANINTSANVDVLFQSARAVLSMDSGSPGRKAFTIESHSSYGIIFSFDNGSQCMEQKPLSTTDWYRISADKNGMVVNGTTISFTTTPSDFSADYTMLLFAYGRNGTPIIFSYEEISKCDIYQNNNLIRKFRPIAIGNKGYMLDLVSGEYLPYGNKGTGDFVIGPTIAYPERERE